MQKTKQKLQFTVNYFKFFGYELEPFHFLALNWLKFLNYWPYTVYSIHMAVAVFLAIQTYFIMFDISFREEFAGMSLKICLVIVGTVGLASTATQRKLESKFWQNLDQLDDFFVRFLDIKLNYRKENWQHLRRVLLNAFLNLIIGSTLSFVNFSSSEKFKQYYNTAIYFVFLNQLNVNKYVFYASIINNRMRILTENFHQISDCDYKVLTVPRIYSIIWKMSHKIEKRYNWPMMLSVINVYMMFFYFGYLLSVDISASNTNLVHFLSFLGPQITISFICYYCNKIKKIVSISWKLCNLWM